MDKVYFNLRFGAFLKDFNNALKDLHQLPASQREDLAHFFDRVERNIGAEETADLADSESEDKTEATKVDDNEHYDPYYRI